MAHERSSTVPAITKAQARVLEFVFERSFGWAVPVEAIEHSPLLESGDSALLAGLIKQGLLGFPHGSQASVCLTGFGHRALSRFRKTAQSPPG